MARAAAVTFVVALALRLIAISQLQDEPLFTTPQLDALEYVGWGAKLAQGDFSWPPAPIHAPGYSFFIGGVLAATKSLLAVRIAQAILGSVAAVLVMSIAGRLFGRVAGIAAGLLHAAYAPLILIDISILAEGLLVFLLTGALWIVVKASLGDFVRPLLPIAAAGLLLGCAVVVRPTAAILVPLFAWFATRAMPKRALTLAVFVAAVAYPVIPVLIQNRGTADPISGIQASGGMNFYIGNSPLHDGTAWARPGGKWDEMRGMAWRNGVRGAAAEDSFYVRQTLQEIRERPAAFAGLLASKALWLIQNEEIRDSHSFHFFAASSALLRWLPRFGVVFALALCGVLAMRDVSPARPPAPHRGNSVWLIGGYAILMAGTVVLLVTGSRYRIPMMPAVLVWAGAGVAYAIEVLRTKRHRAAASLAVVFVAGIFASHLRTHPESHDFSEETAMTAIALGNEGNTLAALEMARRAVSLNPRRDAAWVTLGDIEWMRNRWQQAEQAWLQATRVDDRNARAWSHLALAHIRRGDPRAAEEALHRALSIFPDDEAMHNLAVLRRGGAGSG